MKISIIDLDVSNLYSLTNSLKKLNFNFSVDNSKKKIDDSDCIILPGVGSFFHGSNKLRQYKLDKIILDNYKKGKPIIGICLGFQLLFEKGNEFKKTNGLGILKGHVKELPKKIKFPIPHVGWNKVNVSKIFLNKFINNDYYYFVHSFYVDLNKKYKFYGITDYGKFKFCSAIFEDNVFGFQFHPEKSGNSGLTLLNKTLNYAKKI